MTKNSHINVHIYLLLIQCISTYIVYLLILYIYLWCISTYIQISAAEIEYVAFAKNAVKKNSFLAAKLSLKV